MLVTIDQTHPSISDGSNRVINNEVKLSYWAHTSMKSPITNEHIGDNLRVHQVCVAHSKVPFDIPNKQARSAKLNKSFHKQIAYGLNNPDSSEFTAGLFHLRSQGIVIIAESFEPISAQQKEGLLKFGMHGTIIDGGHNYKIITSNNEDYINGKISIVPDEYVNLFIITGLNKELCPEITEARNTTQKQQAISLANYRGELQFLRDILSSSKQVGMPDYTRQVAFYQNADVDDENQILSAAYLLKVLTTCDLIGFPDGSDHPVEAYSSVEKIVNRVSSNQENYIAMSEIGLDIFRIRDYIVAHSASWLSNVHIIFDTKKSQLDNLIFLNGQSKQHAVLATKLLREPLAYPVLSSLRQFMKVVDSSDGKKIVWRDGYNVGQIMQILDDGLGETLLERVYRSFTENPTGSNIVSVAKNKYVWAQTYSAVSTYLLDKLRG
jgi:hypothetical protein